MTTREKYLANIDRVLMKTLAKQSKSLADKNAIKYDDSLVSQGHIRKIAFDVYKVDNDPYRDLWILQDVDGVPHLVRASNPQSEETVVGEWSATSDYDKRNITLAYKSKPIARFSSDTYGFTPEDVLTFKEALLDKIGADDGFLKEVFAEQPEAKKRSLLSSFPELGKYI
jgi:hypothetical protein